jgi:hypothetical protein
VLPNLAGGDAARALVGYDFRMSRDPRLQAAALRLAAERVERGEALAPELADALANDMARHPEELAAIEAHEGTLPQWMAEELDRRDREDAGTEDDGDVVMARLLAKHSPRRQSALSTTSALLRSATSTKQRAGTARTRLILARRSASSSRCGLRSSSSPSRPASSPKFTATFGGALCGPSRPTRSSIASWPMSWS